MDVAKAPFTASLTSHTSNLSDVHTVNTDDTCFLTNLATELVHRIIDFIPPASHIDFACSCKHLNACSADVFKRHRDAQLKYGVASDIDPATIPTLLRSAFGYGDPILAWHVRSLEVWYDRRGWDLWKMLDFETPVDQNMQSPIAWEFIPGEIDDYLERLEQGQGRLLPRRIDEARTQILDGHDTYLKALLIVHCPRLRDIKFVLPARHEVETCSCLGWLDTFINDSHNRKTSWGPGLQNLRSAAVGLPSGTWMDDAFHPNTEPLNGIGILVQFLRLPHLERLYFKDLEDTSDDEGRASSPRNLSLFSVPIAAAASHNQRVSPVAGLSTASTFSKLQSRNMHSKLVIIGSGPAGHTAAIYAARADLNPVMYEGFMALGIAAGGQLTTTDEVENFPGFTKIGGGKLMEQMREQSEACGTEIISQTVAKVDLKARPFKYWLHPMGDEEEIEEEEHTADALIIATGAKARRLDLKGEDKYWGNGVSACAVCDGSLPMFREQPLVVIGGGDSAVEEALYLTKKASKVTVLVRRDQLRASRTNARRLTTHPKIEILYNTSASEIKGEEKKNGLMTQLVVKNNVTKEEQTLEAKGLFYAVGHDPATELFKGQLDMDEDGYLITKPGEGLTSVEGVFAAGDVQDKRYRQAITSAGSGCIAALEAEKWLAEQDDSVGNELETENQAEKSQTNGVVPEYRSNPLL